MEKLQTLISLFYGAFIVLLAFAIYSSYTIYLMKMYLTSSFNNAIVNIYLREYYPFSEIVVVSILLCVYIVSKFMLTKEALSMLSRQWTLKIFFCLTLISVLDYFTFQYSKTKDYCETFWCHFEESSGIPSLSFLAIICEYLCNILGEHGPKHLIEGFIVFYKAICLKEMLWMVLSKIGSVLLMASRVNILYIIVMAFGLQTAFTRPYGDTAPPFMDWYLRVIAFTFLFDEVIQGTKAVYMWFIPSWCKELLSSDRDLLNRIFNMAVRFSGTWSCRFIIIELLWLILVCFIVSVPKNFYDVSYSMIKASILAILIEFFLISIPRMLYLFAAVIPQSSCFAAGIPQSSCFIGCGPTGIVYDGKYRLRSVAIKRLPKYVLKDIRNIDASVERLQAAKHANIVLIFGAFQESIYADIIQVAAELLNQNLWDYLLVNRGLPPVRRVGIVFQIASGLKYLNTLVPKIIHGRLTPGNVLVGSGGKTFKISDFGQAIYLRNTIPCDELYSAPEILLHLRDKREIFLHDNSDVFSLGVIMSEVATGRKPTGSRDVMHHSGQQVREIHKNDLARLSDDIVLKPIIVDCIENDPNVRPSITFVYELLDKLHKEQVNLKDIQDKIKEARFPIIKEEIGSGSFGTVSRGTLREKPVAIKKISVSRFNRKSYDPDSVDKTIHAFQKEAEMLKLAKHPNIVEFFEEINDNDEKVLLVMELMSEDLGSYLKSNKDNLSTLKQLDICFQITCGLRYLHELPTPILHRDLTPSNVLVNEEGTIFKVSDFGQSKFRASPEAYITEDAPGNFQYMPPEVFEEDKLYSRKSDIFCLGVTMLQVATQAKPSVTRRVIKDEPEVERRKKDIAALQNGHPLRPIILECLYDSPDQRPSVSQVQEFITQKMQATDM